MYAGRPQPLASFDYRGQWRYHLRFSTENRRPLFNNASLVSLVINLLNTDARKENFAVVAYCFMPDHLHLLIEGTAPTSNCRAFSARFKQSSGFACAKEFRVRLWQRYGFDRVLRKDEDSVTVARYIIRNPVRAGLVTSPQDYPFLGSLVYPLEVLLEGIAET